MECVVLASGSKGNSTYIGTSKTKLLIDVGISFTKIKEYLKEDNISIKDITGIIITHEHTDHICALSNFINKTKVKIYMTSKTYEAVSKNLKMDFSYVEIHKNEINEIGDFKIKPISLSHDAVDNTGLIIQDKDNKIVYITDTGYLNLRFYEDLKGADCYIFESNHDVELLLNGPYPHYIKRRILSDKGHLSNLVSAEHLANLITDKTKYIVLAHLSEINNHPKLVLDELKKAFEKHKINFNKKNIIIASQYEPTTKIAI
jgi:phosphoribosyl 1,2-cyclic phosphodiesterase